MKKLKTLFGTIIISVVLPVYSYSQKPEYSFEKVLDNNGKPLGYITDISQDKSGFIWFTTLNGLFRYDGYEFKIFRNVFDDSTSIPFNSFQSFYLDSLGVAWLVCRDTEGRYTMNVLCYNPVNPGNKTLKIEIVDPEKIIEDRYKNIWITTSSSGVYKFNRITGQTENYLYSFSTYPQEIYSFVKSLTSRESIICEIAQVRDNQNLEKTFSLNTDTPVLIVSLGEAVGDPMSDYGYLTSGKDTIWKMDYRFAKHAGGASKNKIEFKTDTLKAGKYTLHYYSDDSHSYGLWNESAPTVLDFYGVKILKLNKEMITGISEYLNKTPGKNMILSNNVRDIATDPLGRLWILTYQGVAEYDYSTNTFLSQRIDFSNILKRNDRSEGPKKFFPDNSNIWIITYSPGVIRYNLKSKSCKVYEDKEIDQTRFDGYYSVSSNDKGQLLLPGFYTASFLDTASGKFNSYESKENNLYGGFESFFEDKAGTLWLSSSEGIDKGIKRKFSYSGLFPIYYHRFLKHTFLDKSEILWFLENEKGLLSSFNYKSRETKTYELSDKNLTEVIRNNPIYNDWLNYIYEDHISNLWLAVSNGLFCFDKVKNKITRSILLPDSVLKTSRNQIVRIFEDKENNLIVFSLYGIYLYDYEKNNLKLLCEFKLTENGSSASRTDNIDDIFEDQDKILWIRTYKGLYTFDRSKNELDSIIKFEDDYFDGIHRGNIFTDNRKDIWCATYSKLYRVSGTDRRIDFFKIRDGLKKVDWNVGYRYYRIIEGDENTLWISTGFGLVKFDKKKSEIKVYSNQAGMISNNICDFEIDSRGILWLATEDGILAFDPENEIFKYYSETFYLSQDTHLKHQYINKNKMKDGTILFFTTYGAVTFNPELLRKTIPPVAITGFSVRDKEYRSDTIINKKRHIKLKYNQNFFSFRFAVLDYENPDQNWYKYKLEGVDDDWTVCDAAHRVAKYTRVAPGEYIFRVKGSNSGGVWNEQGASLKVTVIPPWYMTIPAYILYAIAIVTLLFLYIRYRESKLRKYNEQLENQVKERTLKIERQKEEIQTNRDLVLKQKEHIEGIHKEVTDSINYAKRIQSSALPDLRLLNEHFSDHFILFKPRDVVSGDFYWLAHVEDQIIITVVDCTGHGVPGAFMSMLGMSLLKEIVVKEYITQPDIILRRLRKEVIRALGQTGLSGEQKDGMDISLCSINTGTLEMLWAGANIPCYIFKGNQLIKLEADKMPIAIFDKMDKFNMKAIQLEKNDIIYMSTDGFTDQFGGPDNRKFMSIRFRELLMEISRNPMPEQRNCLEKSIEDWKNFGNNDYAQTDDITIMGLKI